MPRSCSRLSAGLLLLMSGVATAQFAPQTPAKGVRLDKQVTQRWQVGVKITVRGLPCSAVRGSVPVPKDWPEQQVRVVNEEVSPLVRVGNLRDSGGVRQMPFFIQQLPPGEVATALVTFEITRSSMLPPDDPAQYLIPKNLPAAIRPELAASPLIESRHPSIRDKAKELWPDNGSAWEQIQTLYDWVRENIKLQDGKLKGAVAALRDGNGNRDDVTSLFIALCRASGVPARTVFVPDNCYAEFYLQDPEGTGYWFPCQLAGTREFGGMSDHRTILQKGDNIKVPDEPNPQRFVPEYLSGKGPGQPQVEFIRKVLPAN